MDDRERAKYPETHSPRHDCGGLALASAHLATSPCPSSMHPLLSRLQRAWPVLLLVVSGCASVTPRFPPEVAHSFARDVMRKMETDQVQLYYPEVEKAAAERTLGRLDACVRLLRSNTLSSTPRQPLLVYMTRADFNNAYVSPAIGGQEQFMLLPQHLSLELFNWFELGMTQIGDVSCHEAVHAVQMQQTDGFWRALNLVFGDLYSPNDSIESWFMEGLATYYEGRLDRHAGRSRNPIWHALFLSGVAERGGRIGPGDLSSQNRDMLPVGGNYLSGMHFVEYLARRFGERKLWELIDLQGESIFSPLWVTLRFKVIYGETVGALLEDYSRELTETVRDRHRPPDQRVIDPDLGYLARLAASHRDGALAAVIARRNQVTVLEVREPDGKLRFSFPLKPLFPGRKFLQSNPELVSGLSFSGDGERLYLVLADTAEDGADSSQLLELSARTGDLLRHWILGPAMGGAADPSGGAYVYIEVQGQTSNLVRFDLATGEKRPLTHFQLGESIGAPDVGPDGRIVFAVRAEAGMDIALLERNGQVRALTRDANFDYFPRWVDARHIAFVREPQDPDAAIQVQVMDLASGELKQVTHAPFLAFDPVITASGRLAFLNRQGWSWTLDETQLPTLAEAAPSASKLAENQPPAIGEQTGESANPADVVPIQEARPPVLRDQPYDPTDHLFYPELRAPYVIPTWQYDSAGNLIISAAIGVTLRGEDRLGKHTWAIDLRYDTFDNAPSVSAGYGNYQLAPWFLSISGQRTVYRGNTDTGATLAASRPLWTSAISFGFDALQHNVAGVPSLDLPPIEVRVVGPTLAYSYFAGDSSPYAGTQRGLGLDLAGAVYPKFLGSSDNLADLGGTLTAYVPLPIRANHSLRVLLTERLLLHAPRGLLQVGGVGPDFTIYQAPRSPIPTFQNYLTGVVQFIEPLRGYEDFPIRANNATIGEARYRYSFPIDKGFASFLYLLPSLFFRQVDLDAFGSAAATDLIKDGLAEPAAFHRAVGAQIAIRTSWGDALPLSFFYQFSQRFDDGLGAFHLVGVRLE